jgi:hypothetical protein
MVAEEVDFIFDLDFKSDLAFSSEDTDGSVGEVNVDFNAKKTQPLALTEMDACFG